MDDFTSLENLEQYFKKVNCYGSHNYCFTAQKDSSMIPYLFGAIGGLVVATNSVKNKKVMGYLFNQFDDKICLIPIIADTFTKNKVDMDHYCILKKEQIKKVVIKKEDFVFIKIKIIMNDNTQYIMRTTKKLKNAPYHEKNLSKVIELYS